jgi:hypothetical protein
MAQTIGRLEAMRDAIKARVGRWHNYEVLERYDVAMRETLYGWDFSAMEPGLTRPTVAVTVTIRTAPRSDDGVLVLMETRGGTRRSMSVKQGKPFEIAAFLEKLTTLLAIAKDRRDASARDQQAVHAITEADDAVYAEFGIDRSVRGESVNVHDDTWSAVRRDATPMHRVSAENQSFDNPAEAAAFAAALRAVYARFGR